MLMLSYFGCSSKIVNQVNQQEMVESWIKEYIQQNGDDKSKSDYTFSKIELNKNISTYLINIEGEYWCGSGGCSTLLIGEDDSGKFKLINDFSPISNISAGKKVFDGWRELHVIIGDGGSTENQKYLYNSKLKEYELVE